MSNDTQATNSEESADDYVLAFHTNDGDLRLGSEKNHNQWVESDTYVDLQDRI